MNTALALEVTHNNIQEALALFRAEKRGLALTCALFDALVRGETGSEDEAMRRATSGFTHDLWNLFTLVRRVEWQDRIAAREEISVGDWNSYCSVDIEMFFVQTISALDHIATAINCFIPHPKKSGEIAFGTLQREARDGKSHLPTQLSSLLKEMDWWVQITNIRNDFVHRPSETIVFEWPGAGIKFGLTRGTLYAGSVNEGTALDIARFDLYASEVLAALLVTGERIGRAMFVLGQRSHGASHSKSFHPANELVLDWLKKTLLLLSSDVPQRYPPK